jgi:hypothetical protein
MPWAFLSQQGPHLQLAFAAGDGDCTLPVGVQVEVTEASVTVTVWSQTDRSRSACAAKLVTGAGTLTLQAPLGDRNLVHAPVSRPWDDVAGQLP